MYCIYDCGVAVFAADVYRADDDVGVDGVFSHTPAAARIFFPHPRCRVNIFSHTPAAARPSPTRGKRG
jgi:hypothetical protein